MKTQITITKEIKEEATKKAIEFTLAKGKALLLNATSDLFIVNLDGSLILKPYEPKTHEISNSNNTLSNNEPVYVLTHSFN